MYNGVKWQGTLTVNQEPDDYDSVLLETTESEKMTLV